MSEKITFTVLMSAHDENGYINTARAVNLCDGYSYHFDGISKSELEDILSLLIGRALKELVSLKGRENSQPDLFGHG